MPSLAPPSFPGLSRWLAATGLAVLFLCACSKHGSSGTASSPAKSPMVPAATEEHLIAQARAALGPEDKLLAVQALALTGKVFDEKDQLLGTIQFLFKKPARQRSEFHSTTESRVIECSNGMEGWILSSDKTGKMKFDIVKDPAQTQNIYTAMENLYFYRAAELVRGSTVSSEGPVTYRNNPCWKVSFRYPDGLTYIRYLDKTTGELRGTVLQPAGTEFVEEGKKTVDGIIFPAMLHNYSKDGILTQTVKFESIVVNPNIDDRVFDMPSLVDLRAAMAKTKTTATAAQSTTPPPHTASPAAAK